MTWLIRAARSSVGRKQIVAVSGLLLCGFLVVHLAGNFLIFVGKEAFDAYAAALTSKPALLYPAETVLALIFLSHIAMAINVTVQNWRARPRRYAVRASTGEATLASSTMILSGAIVLVFLVLHLLDFKFALEEGGSLYELVIGRFQNGLFTVWYVFAVCVLGLHVSHGLQSAVRTLGIDHPRWTPVVRGISKLFALVVALGYSSIPVYAFFFCGAS